MNFDICEETLPVVPVAQSAVPESKLLDAYFDRRARALADHYTKLCQHALAQGCTALPYEYAKAAAHWLKVAQAA